ncbi:hypothetical protein ACO0R3_002214 [Hanseniaspora guilliermondii]
MDTSLDMDSMNLLQEMEDISNALKKQQIQHISNSDTITDINQLINNENNLSSDEDISNMPISNFKSNSVQSQRLNSISNAIQNHKNTAFTTTDNESDLFVSAKEEFISGSEFGETDLDKSDQDMLAINKNNTSSFELKKEHMKLRISSVNSDIFNKRLFSINSDILNHVTISDQKGNNSRQVSQEVQPNEKEENTLILEEQTEDVTKMLKRIDTGLENNQIIMDSDNSRLLTTSHNNTIDSEGDFNSSFSLKISNKDGDDLSTSDTGSLTSVKYSKFEQDINNNSNLRMSSSDGKRSISSSSNKFKASRIISPSQIVQLSPDLPSLSSFEQSFSIFDHQPAAAKKSQYKEVMNRIISSDIEYQAASSNNLQLDQSRDVLRKLRRRVTSDILKAEIPEIENNNQEGNVNLAGNRVSSSHSLLLEMNKVWESAIGSTSNEASVVEPFKVAANTSNDNKLTQIWQEENTKPNILEMDGYEQSELVKRTLKNSDDHVIQRTSTGLGIYHNLQLINDKKNQQDDSSSNENVTASPQKRIIIGNVQDLLLQNGITLDDIKQDHQNYENIITENKVLPQTPKKSNNSVFEKVKINSPVKVVDREVEQHESKIPEEKSLSNKDLEGKKTVLKLKNNQLKNLGYLYISLNSLTLTNFINTSYPNITFADKKVELQIIFDNGSKIIESEWITLTGINSGKLAERINLSSQEYVTEIPIKETLSGYDDIVSTLQFTFKMRYDQPKSKILEIQDRIPLVQSNNVRNDEDRSNSLTKKIFSRKPKHGSSSSGHSGLFNKNGRKVEYQTIIRKVEQKAQDPWICNFSPDGETFGLLTIQLSLSDVFSMTNIIYDRKCELLSTSSFNGSNVLSKIGTLDLKTLHLSHINKVIPKSISAINDIFERKQSVLNIKYDDNGFMYQQGLDVSENSGVKRRKFILEKGLLNGYGIDDSGELKLSINLENVDEVLLDCESCPAPGYNFELVFYDKARVVLSCDTMNQRKAWLAKMKEVLDVLKVVRELEIEIKH